MKYTLMVLLLITFLFKSDVIHSQTFIWKTPQPLTDSLSNNQNPVIGHIEYFDGPGYYVFWERSTDSFSTDIYVKNIYSTDDPQPFIFEGEYHYQNPHQTILNQIFF